MLESLKVKNVALIDESEVTFGEGLNILTGETGAGKSILIDSINLALGAKADSSLIRQGAEYAYVELCFQVNNASVIQKLKELEVFPDEEGRVLLQRRIMTGKSSCRLNGESATGKLLQQVAAVLIDVHGQHEHQSLLNEKSIWKYWMHSAVTNYRLSNRNLVQLMQPTEKKKTGKRSTG